jgi:hypothetical protein
MAVITIAEKMVGEAKTTLSATPNTMQEFSVPGNARMVEVLLDKTGFVIHNDGTDGATITTEVAYDVAANTPYYWPIPRSAGRFSFWVASDHASTVCKVLTYEGD